MNLELINNKIESTSIKAQCSGIINLINDINQGDYIQAGTQIASIIPNENTKFKAEIYIENQKLTDIKNKKISQKLCLLSQHNTVPGDISVED